MRRPCNDAEWPSRAGSESSASASNVSVTAARQSSWVSAGGSTVLRRSERVRRTYVVGVGVVDAGLVQSPEEVVLHTDQMTDQPLDVEVPHGASAPLGAVQ